MKRLSRILPVVIAGGVILWLAMQFRPADVGGPFDLPSFGRVLVVDQGRVKPLDTYARLKLMLISDRQTFVDNAGERQPAMRFIADAMTFAIGNDAAVQHEVFRVENGQVLELMGLEARPGHYRYSYRELHIRRNALIRQAMQAQQTDAAQRSLFQTKVLELWTQLATFEAITSWREPLMAPPAGETDEWRTLSEVATAATESGDTTSPAAMLGRALGAYAANDPETFNAELDRYHLAAGEHLPLEARRSNIEVLFNRVDPFGNAMMLYLAAGLLVLVGWLVWMKPLHRSAVTLLVIALIVHTAAIVVRMVLQGRPPVTNLYSSAIFISWGCVGLGLVIELLFRFGIGAAVAAVTGFLVLLIADRLGGGGEDTLEMMQAVLDTNFWLATHVTTITLGYVATFVAGALGIALIGLGLFTPLLRRGRLRTLDRMIYGVICFALLLSFVGTVLGGIWADQSWGRFWGWDPKENGALMIVLWNAVILHARWGGMIGWRGVAAAAVFGNIITGWSWFGVNMLGVGLHSYGFMDSAVFWLATFAYVNLVIAVAGLAPRHMWRSLREEASSTEPASPSSL